MDKEVLMALFTTYSAPELCTQKTRADFGRFANECPVHRSISRKEVTLWSKTRNKTYPPSTT